MHYWNRLVLDRGRWRRPCTAGIVAAMAGCLAGCTSAAPDLVVVNGRVWTGMANQPAATGFAVRNGRFVFVGDDDAARQRAGADTRIVDAGGSVIVPGLIDAHLHLLSGGLQLGRLNLRDVSDRDTFIQRIADRATVLPPEQWLLGGRWSTESWPDPTQPTRKWIDPVTGERPTLLSRMDGHSALANTAALERARIDPNGPPDPVGGVIDRDPTTGEPTGILRESAIDLVAKLIPQPSDDALDRALRAAMRHANLHGLTCVHTMSPWVSAARREIQ